MKVFFFILSALLISGNLKSQESKFNWTKFNDSIYYANQKDIKDLLREWFGPKKDSIDPRLNNIGKDDATFNFLPGVSYNPATDFVIGFNASKSWYLGERDVTNNSSANLSASYTSKGQFKFSFQQNIFSNRNDWNFQGDARLWLFTQDTYGLGSNTKPSASEKMDFNFIRFNENILKKVSKNLYLGIGYSLEYYYNMSTVDSSGIFLYPNHNNTYAQFYGLDSSRSISSGISTNFYYDSRDNTVNTYRGAMLNLQYLNYNTIFGSESNWQKIEFDARAYLPLNKESTNRLAFWMLGTWVLNGRPPYMSLTSTGWDKYNTSGRGYIQGRFRGRQYLYGEIAERFDLTNNGLFGMVFFLNGTTTSNPETGLSIFDYIEPGGGVGLRIKFDKYSRTNLCIDFGIGNYGSNGIFFSMGEFF